MREKSWKKLKEWLKVGANGREGVRKRLGGKIEGKRRRRLEGRGAGKAKRNIRKMKRGIGHSRRDAKQRNRGKL